MKCVNSTPLLGSNSRNHIFGRFFLVLSLLQAPTKNSSRTAVVWGKKEDLNGRTADPNLKNRSDT